MMKSLVAAAVCAGGVCLAFLPSEAGAAPPVPTWTGFYVGAEGGYGIGSLEFGVDNEAAWDGFGMKGWTAGGFIGYEQQFNSGWVGGFEFAGDWSDIGSDLNIRYTDGTEYLLDAWFRTDWTASLSARFGYLVNPNTLFFGSAGITAGQMSYGYAYGEDGSILDEEEEGETFYGLAFVGVGAETYLANHLRFRYQYLINFFSHDFDGIEVSPTQGIAKAALIYDFGGPPGEAMPAVYGPESWTGLYAGVNAGHSMGMSSLVAVDGSDSFYWDGFGATGLNAGAFVGANVQLGSCLVFGIEAGASASNLDWELTYGPDSLRYTTTSWYDVRARVGFLPNRGTLIYGFAGYARLNSELGYSEYGNTLESETYTRNAIEFGGGIEAWVTRNISLRAEYQFRQLDDFAVLDDSIWLQSIQSSATVGAVVHLGK